jgi:hypothetical protein|tara:strand:+ start:761 stop:991 length:231 start_codon:yes stop_codon:yes gene_type:complete
MKIKKSELLALIKEEIMGEMDVAAEPMMQEGFENITPENMQLVADALQKMAPMIGAMSLPVLIGLIYEQLKNMGAK